MDLTALVDSPDHVCCRYRLAAFRPLLEQAGHRLELVPLPNHLLGWFRLGRHLDQAGMVILQRKLLQAWQLHLVRRNAKRLVFDFDDAVFQRDSYAVKKAPSSSRQHRFAAVLAAADAVVAGNPFLRDQALSHAAGPVHLVPTVVDPAGYPLATHQRQGRGTELVWIGSSSTLQGLEAIRPVLEAAGQRWPGLRLKLVCDRFIRLQHLPVIDCRWTEAGESASLAAADIGISWIPDDNWSRGKCGLKVLQYMAAGLPVVANPVGVQADMVRPGVNGFLAETPEQWTDAIGRLAHDPVLRREMGTAGRRRVETDFSVAEGARRWLGVLEKLQRHAA